MRVIQSPAAQRHELWATTLRADFLWTSNGPRIVEVNSDNVGGVEDLLLHLSFYAQRHDVEPGRLRDIQLSLGRIRHGVFE